MDDPFTAVSLEFKRLGAISAEEYLSSSKYDSLQVNYSFRNLGLNLITVQRAVERDHVGSLKSHFSEAGGVENILQDEEENSMDALEAVELLQSQCRHYFPKYAIDHILKWELDKDCLLLKGGKRATWRARLTICKPDGTKMSLDSSQSESIELARNDAATQAIQKGAMDFIAGGASSADAPTPARAQREHNATLDSSSHEPDNMQRPEDGISNKEKKRRRRRDREAAQAAAEEQANIASTPSINQIGTLVAQHNHPNSILRWYQHINKKLEHTPGISLIIKLSDTSYRIYSSSSEGDTAYAAKEECARIALADDLGQFLQSCTESSTTSMVDDRTSWNDAEQFYNALDPSIRAHFGDQPFAKLHPVNWLNTSLKRLKGSRLVHSFQLVRGNGDNRNLFGCILRFERDNESRTYFVEPRFRKEKDARTAVCLQAMLEGAAEYFRSLEVILQASISGKMKYLANSMRAALQSDIEAQPSDRNLTPTYKINFQVDRDAYGATMVLKIDSHGEDGREYIVPCQYRCEAHAEVAVLCTAARDGALEYVRFRGRGPPPGYVPVLAREATAELSKQETRLQSASEVEPGEVLPDRKVKTTKAITSSPSIPPQFTPPFALSQYPDVMRSTGPSYSLFASQHTIGGTFLASTPGLYHAQEFLQSGSSAQMGAITSFTGGPRRTAGARSHLPPGSAATSLPSSSKRPSQPDNDDISRSKRARKT